MASPSAMQQTAGPVLVESAIPTLKVMRLQKPELHVPMAGTLETRSLLGSAMCLPDSFGVIHVGETFTAYLGALNVSKNLNVTRLTVTAQLQTPSQRWHLASRLDEGNEAGGVEIPPDQGIDTIVSHALEEAGQHILRVEVGYGTSEGIKTLRKFYRFQVSNPLLISELTYRTGDASCFVSISLENNALETKGGLTICSADFDPAPGLSAERVGGPHHHNQDDSRGVDLYDGCGRLEAGASIRYLFKVTATSKEAALRGVAAGDELGKAIFTWRKAVGEMGRMASSPVICPHAPPMLDPSDPSATMMGKESSYVVYVHGSSLSVDVATAAANRAANPNQSVSLDTLLAVTVEPIDPPSRMQFNVPQEIQFLIVNHSSQAKTIQLQFHLNHMKGLAVCGPSFKNLDEVPGSGGSTTTSLLFIPLEAGLLRVHGCCIVDLATGLEIPQPPLFNVFVDSYPDEYPKIEVAAL